MKLSDISLEDERCREAFVRIVAQIDDKAEDWRYAVTPGFTSSDYLVSDQGRVVSLPRYRHYDANARSQVRHRKFLPGGLMSPGTQPSGHQTIALSHNKKLLRTHVHRLVVWTFLGPQPAGYHVRHLDGNPANNRLDNLAYATTWDVTSKTPNAATPVGGGLVITPALEQRIEAALEGRDDPFSVLRDVQALLAAQRDQ